MKKTENKEKVAATILLVVTLSILGGYAVNKIRIYKTNKEYIKMNNLAAEAIKSGQFQQAQHYAEIATKIIPNEIGGHINAASAYIATGNYPAAYRHSVITMKITPVRQISQNLEIICEKLGRGQESQYWKQVSLELIKKEQNGG